MTPALSRDAAMVLGLAGTALPFARTREDEAERWLRVLRLHGGVAGALQAVGVGEAPLQRPHKPVSSPGIARERHENVRLWIARGPKARRYSSIRAG